MKRAFQRQDKYVILWYCNTKFTEIAETNYLYDFLSPVA